jgi:hypothetical protein
MRNVGVGVRAVNVLPIIQEAQKAGARTLREIAEALNARGIATARGGQWYAQSVANILERAYAGLAASVVTVPSTCNPSRGTPPPLGVQGNRI